ncbi:vWA domain-containing protein [Aliiroseovarius sp. PTFE2010]|uniref:vWA domain-containing protein n=1 Tax=Aliiroseovarius sp. PTFE2010 TaxID=3417190 RepID=UPI003CF00AB9
MEFADLDIPEDGKLAHNIVHFARALRVAGVPVGPGRVIDAIRAVEAAGFTERRDFFYTLQACFVSRPEQRRVYAQLFRLFWRDPRYMEHMMSMMLPSVRGVQEEKAAEAAEKRATEALVDGAKPEMPEREEQDGDEIEIDASATASGDELLRTLDFEQMSNAEMAEAKRVLAKLELPVPPIKSRRMESRQIGRIAQRATIRSSMRKGGEIVRLEKQDRRVRWPNLVVLCDISGSMATYSRIILHFVHAVANQQGAGWAKVHAFTFGTQLTNITRHLATRDVDAALKSVGHEAQDWEGGTRIGQCLHQFNRDWSRRVLGQAAVVLLVTDGLDRDDPANLARAAERLHLSSRKLIWLNPLMRFDGFAPKAQGIRALMPHVDSFRAGHNIASLSALAAALSRPDDRGERDRMMAMLRADGPGSSGTNFRA